MALEKLELVQTPHGPALVGDLDAPFLFERVAVPKHEVIGAVADNKLLFLFVVGDPPPFPVGGFVIEFLDRVKGVGVVDPALFLFPGDLDQSAVAVLVCVEGDSFAEEFVFDRDVLQDFAGVRVDAAEFGVPVQAGSFEEVFAVKGEALCVLIYNIIVLLIIQ